MAQGRVLLIIFIFVIDVVVLLMLLCRCILGYWAPRYHQHDLKRLLLLRCVLW
jgi:hypothetical protein